MGRKLAGYGLLLRDAATVVRTLATRYGGPARAQAPLGLAAQTRAAVERFHPRRFEARIAEKVMETPSTVTLRLEPTTGRVPPRSGGQYVNVALEIDGVTTSRAYSLSSWSPELDHYDVTVKERPGGHVSRYLVRRAEEGERVLVSGPAGEFVHNPLRDSDELVLIAAGSGVTPLMAIIDDMRIHRPHASLLLLYGSRNEREIIFRDRLAELERNTEPLRIVHTLSQPSTTWTGARGRVSARLLDRHVNRDELARKTFFVCGPHLLKLDMLHALQERAVARHRVHFESYGPPVDVTQEPGWPEGVSANTRFSVTLLGRDEPIEVRAGEPLLASLERAGEVRHALCRSDVCDTCKARLKAGTVFVPTDASRRVPTRPGEMIRLCTAYPLSDLELDE